MNHNIRDKPKIYYHLTPIISTLNQVDLAMDVQEALPTFIWRRSIIKKRTVYPNRNQGTAISRAYYSFIGTEQLAAQAITRALNPPKVGVIIDGHDITIYFLF